MRSTRLGLAWLPISLALVAFVALGGGAWYFVSGSNSRRPVSKALVREAVFGPFRHEVTERGEIESSSNVEIRCKVKARSAGSGTATSILEIVPEGTHVKKGDFLVRFDSSALENEKTQQQIVCNTSAATVIQSRSVYETAVIACKEYLEGTFTQDRETLESEVFVAEENLRKAQDFVAHSEKLAAKGYVTALQLDADRFAVEKAKKDLDIAKTKLRVLSDFTKEKMLKQLEADIATAEARLKADEDIHRLDVQKLKEIEDQIANCVVVAPQEGQVVYANETSGRGDNEIVIEEGTMIRENQVVIRLPDPTRMQVKAKVNESQIDLVREKMPARIRVDAFPNLELKGAVTRVEDFPAPRSWFNSAVKEYGAIVSIDSPPPGLRPGMTAEVKILVDAQQDVVQVPVQAVVEHEGRHFVLQPLAEPAAFKVLPVGLGSTNDEFVIIREGLPKATTVVVNPRAFLELVSFPAGPKREVESLPPEALVGKEAPRAGVEPREAPSDEEGDRPRRRRRGGGEGDLAMGGADPAQIVSMMFQRLDKNSDGKISQDEWPAERSSDFAATDANGDGGVDAEEMTAAMSKMMERMRQGGGGSPGPGAANGASQ